MSRPSITAAAPISNAYAVSRRGPRGPSAAERVRRWPQHNPAFIIFSTATAKLIDGIGCVGAFCAKFPARGQKPELIPCRPPICLIRQRRKSLKPLLHDRFWELVGRPSRGEMDCFAALAMTGSARKTRLVKVAGGLSPVQPPLTPPHEEREGESPFSSCAARDPRRPRARPRAIRA